MKHIVAMLLLLLCTRALQAQRAEPATRQALLAELIRYLSYDGTYKELPKWFEQHKDKLVFDPKTKRYGSTKTDKPNP